jgi:hypothetical protein
MRQCSCILACREHSSLQARHTAMHVCNTAPTIAASKPTCRDSTRAVAPQMSAQSRFAAMHAISSATIVLAEAGVGAGRTGRGALNKRVDGRGELPAVQAGRLRVGLEHRGRGGHDVLQTMIQGGRQAYVTAPSTRCAEPAGHRPLASVTHPTRTSTNPPMLSR